METETYACKTCGTPIFGVGEKVGASSNSIAFKRPLAEDKIQSRKNQDGQWQVRCSKCHSVLGSAIGGKNPHYRIQSTQVEEKDRSLPVPAFEVPQREPEQTGAPQTSEPSVAANAAAIFGAGVAVGAIVGAIVVFLIFRNLETPISATNPEATTTSVISTPAPAPLPTPTPRPAPPAPTPLPASTSTATTSDANPNEAGTL